MLYKPIAFFVDAVSLQARACQEKAHTRDQRVNVTLDTGAAKTRAVPYPCSIPKNKRDVSAQAHAKKCPWGWD